MAAQIIDSMSRDWDPKRYEDTYRVQVLDSSEEEGRRRGDRRRGGARGAGQGRRPDGRTRGEPGGRQEGWFPADLVVLVARASSSSRKSSCGQAVLLLGQEVFLGQEGAGQEVLLHVRGAPAVEASARAPEDLYGLPLEEFTPARDALAKELKAAGRKDEAAEVKSLRKPSVAAWALNRVAREHPDAVEGLRAAGAVLREAQDAVCRGHPDPGNVGRRRPPARRRPGAGRGGRPGGRARWPTSSGRAGRPASAAQQEKIVATLRTAAVDDDAGRRSGPRRPGRGARSPPASRSGSAPALRRRPASATKGRRPARRRRRPQPSPERSGRRRSRR